MSIFKKILKTFIFSFLGAYLLSLTLVIFTFIQNKTIDTLIDFPGATILTAVGSLIYAFFATIILLVFSLLEERILNKLFVFGFSLCYITINFILFNSGNKIVQSINSFWYYTIVIIIPLLIVIFILKIHKKYLKK
ncbi:MAG: hypothetical protein HY005_00680 [Candidatus Staskawiczbacteria bacterium]|nr:hypothetical protein [Candidatus Staskawiczbacteria bacterium]